jgi:hypothetical protein
MIVIIVMLAVSTAFLAFGVKKYPKNDINKNNFNSSLASGEGPVTVIRSTFRLKKYIPETIYITDINKKIHHYQFDGLKQGSIILNTSRCFSCTA